MPAAYLICVLYAALGVLYAPGVPALLAFGFIAVSASPLLLTWSAARREPALPHPAPGLLGYWLLLGLGGLNLWLLLRGLDVGLAEVLTTEGFVRAAATATTRRYEDQGSSGNPVLLSLSLFLMYRVGAASHLLTRWKIALAFVPMLLYTLLSTEKWPLFLSFSFFLLGIFAALAPAAALARVARYVLLFVALGGALAGLALVLRGFDGDALELPAQLLHYVLAPFPAFGQWWAGQAPDQCCSGGATSLIGIADQLGWVRREAGVFAENAVVYGSETNIYTAWRYLVQDFGDLGPLALNLALALAYLASRQIGWPIATRALRGFVLCCALLSLNVTPFVHNSVALAIVIALSYSAWVQWRRAAPPFASAHEPTRTVRLRPRQGQPAAQAAHR